MSPLRGWQRKDTKQIEVHRTEQKTMHVICGGVEPKVFIVFVFCVILDVGAIVPHTKKPRENWNPLFLTLSVTFVTGSDP